MRMRKMQKDGNMCVLQLRQKYRDRDCLRLPQEQACSAHRLVDFLLARNYFVWLWLDGACCDFHHAIYIANHMSHYGYEWKRRKCNTNDGDDDDLDNTGDFKKIAATNERQYFWLKVSYFKKPQLCICFFFPFLGFESCSFVWHGHASVALCGILYAFVRDQMYKYKNERT